MQKPTAAGQTELQARIETKIAEIAAIADEIPGVIIIHSNNGMGLEYMSPRGLEMLGITLEELREMGPAYYERFFNLEEAKDYVPKIISSLERNDQLEWVSFFQQVRNLPDMEFNWYASSTKIFMRDETGNPILNITVSIPLDIAHHNTSKVDRLLKENEFLRKNYHKFSKLSGREHDILKLTVLGKSATEIAEDLFISAATVETHRKNIKKKLEAQSTYELSQYAMAFNLI